MGEYGADLMTFCDRDAKEIRGTNTDRCVLHSVIWLIGSAWISCCYCTDSKCTWNLNISTC